MRGPLPVRLSHEGGPGAASLQELLGHADGQMTKFYVRSVRQRSALRKQRQVNLAAKLFGEGEP